MITQSTSYLTAPRHALCNHSQGRIIVPGYKRGSTYVVLHACTTKKSINQQLKIITFLQYRIRIAAGLFRIGILVSVLMRTRIVYIGAQSHFTDVSQLKANFTYKTSLQFNDNYTDF